MIGKPTAPMDRTKIEKAKRRLGFLSKVAFWTTDIPVFIGIPFLAAVWGGGWRLFSFDKSGVLSFITSGLLVWSMFAFRNICWRVIERDIVTLEAAGETKTLDDLGIHEDQRDE